MHSIQKPETVEPDNEIVFTVTDYYDGPRKGIANYQGKPHFYECIFDSTKDAYSDLYWLTSLDEPTFDLAMEDWAIWRRWELAFHTDKVGIESHPALPQDAARHEELQEILNSALQTGPGNITRIAKFSGQEHAYLPKGVIRPMQVKWMEP